MFRHKLPLAVAASPAMRYGFDRDDLPNPASYYRDELPGLKIRGEWGSACCPFHDDRNPSFAVNLASGFYRCHACNETGRDVLAFQMARYGQDFRQAAQALGAWRGPL